MPLTATSVKNAKPKDRLYRVADQHGLCLEVTPKGAKHWRFRYRFQGKATMLGLGSYPTVSLAEARERHGEARKFLEQGVDPKQVKRTPLGERPENSFENIAREWFRENEPRLAPAYAKDVIERLERDVFPWLGPRPVEEISAPEILTVLKRIQGRGAIETARRQLQKIGQIYRYAIATGRAVTNPATDLKGAIPPPPRKHLASITEPRAVGELLRAIDGYSGDFVTRCALRLIPHVFTRPGELRHAEWSEINFDAAEWRIPGPKMKMRREHIVPLSRQAIAILKEIQPMTGGGKYVFPSMRDRSRAMSENTITGALRRMGYSSSEMTGHGFRHMASTLLNEQSWNRDWIERQLAHAPRDAVRSAYNTALYLEGRTKMMQSWSDFLDGLREQGRVIPLRHTAND